MSSDPEKHYFPEMRHEKYLIFFVIHVSFKMEELNKTENTKN
jgi:hypothetical protein